MNQGYYKRRRGILDHLEGGAVSLLDTGIHDYLCLKMNGRKDAACNIPPGVVFTSSKAIAALCPKGISERSIRRSLANLEKRGWIKCWKVRGKHGNYPVLVARSSVHDEQGNEYRVIAEETTDWRTPTLKLIEAVSGKWPRTGHDLSTDRELRSKNQRKPAAKPAATPDRRFQQIVDCYFETTRKAGIEPSSDKSDFGALSSWLKKNPRRTLDSILGTLRNAFASTDHCPLRPGFRLREFLSHEAKYQRGPLLKSGPKPVESFRLAAITEEPIHVLASEEIPA